MFQFHDGGVSYVETKASLMAEKSGSLLVFFFLELPSFGEEGRGEESGSEGATSVPACTASGSLVRAVGPLLVVEPLDVVLPLVVVEGGKS